MNAINAQDAQINFSHLLERVSGGERIVIMSEGNPVAVIGPAEPRSANRTMEALETFRQYRKRMRLDGLPLKDLIEEGRR